MTLYKIFTLDYHTHKTFYVIADNPDTAVKMINTTYNNWYGRDIKIEQITPIANDNRYTDYSHLIIKV